MERPPASVRRRLSAAVVALAAVAFTLAYPMQVNGYNQNAHYAFVRALADGKPYVDQALGEIGEVSTRDTSRFEGHTYATKAPGLALVSLPAFAVVEATGMRTTGDPTRVIWALHLWGSAAAVLALALLVLWLGNRLEPGLGLAAAVTLGLATLMLPFGTLFFSHALAALVGFAAFAVLWRERDGPQRLALVAAGGALAGFGVAIEHPLVFVGLVLGAYAIARPDWLRRGVAYSLGVLVGLAPLLLYNTWAFRNPFHFTYEDNLTAPGIDPDRGFFGFGVPSLGITHDLLFSAMGLLVLTPVLALALVGLVLLWRRRPVETLVIGGVIAAYLLYNSSLRYFSPFGGLGPPRYLVTLVPFAALPLALTYRRFPLTTLGLAIVSAFQMVVMTATGPLAAYDGEWLQRVRAKEFVQTAASLVDVTGWYTIAPYCLAVLVAIVAAGVASRGVALRLAELPVAAAAVAAWAVAALAAENPNGTPPGTGYVVALAVAATAGVALLALAARWASQNVSAAPTPKRTAEHSGQVTA
jgi:4-amino-4-deoxy-L-arabinose transferase-like glycosyltransferase